MRDADIKKLLFPLAEIESKVLSLEPFGFGFLHFGRSPAITEAGNGGGPCNQKRISFFFLSYVSFLFLSFVILIGALTKRDLLSQPMGFLHGTALLSREIRMAIRLHAS